MATTYTYTVAATYQPYNLSKNIGLSTITTGGGLLGISFDGISNLQVTFNSALSGGDQTTLNSLVTNSSAIFVTPDQMLTQYKYICKYATTTAGTLATSFASGQTVDSNTLAVGDRILIKNQTNGIENGIYYVTAGAPVRSSDFLNGYAGGGIIVNINIGTVNGATLWMCTNTTGLVPPTDIVGTNALTFNVLTPSRSNYFYVYSTQTQLAAANQTFQAVTFNGANNIFNGWTASGGPPITTLTCNQTGLYCFIYQGSIVTTAGTVTQTGTLIIQDNGAEIIGSQCNTQNATSGIPRTMTQSFLYNVTAGHTITMQFAATISGGSNCSLGPDATSLGTRITVSMTVDRIA